MRANTDPGKQAGRPQGEHAGGEGTLGCTAAVPLDDLLSASRSLGFFLDLAGGAVKMNMKTKTKGRQKRDDGAFDRSFDENIRGPDGE